nr:MAG TPA: hypothetical protein [Caudoviricetes sp.]
MVDGLCLRTGRQKLKRSVMDVLNVRILRQVLRGLPIKILLRIDHVLRSLI